MGGLKINTTGGVNVKKKTKGIKINTTASKPKNDGSVLGYASANVGIGLAGLFEGLGDFVAGSYYQLIGDDDYAKYLHMNDVTGGWKARLDKDFNPSSTVKFIGDISGAVGQALPSVALGIATAGGSAAVQAMGTVALGASYAGRGITSAVQQTGELGFKENAYGVTAGALEGVTDMFLGGTVKAGKALITTARQAAKVGAKKVARNTLIKGVLSSAVSEAAEEFIQEYADTFLLRLTGVNKEAEYSPKNAMYSALIGGISGGILGGVTNGINNGINVRIGQDVQARGLTDQLLNTANYVRDVHIGNSKNYSNITSQSLKALTASVDAYRGLNAEQKQGVKGAMILGEIKQELLAFESSAGVDDIKAKMMQSDEQTRLALAKSASELLGKEITAEDIATNKGDITRRIALESFVTGALGDNPMEMKRAEVDEAIAAERLPYINSSESWNGESARYRDPKSGKYILIEPAKDGTWKMAYSPTAVFDAENLMIKDGLSVEDVKKTLSGLRAGSLDIGENGIRAKGEVDPDVVKSFANTKKGRKAKKDYKRQVKEEKKNAVISKNQEKMQVSGKRYSLTRTRAENLGKLIDDLGKKRIRLKTPTKEIVVGTDEFTKNKAIFSQKGRTNREVNTRVKAIPHFAQILQSAKYSYTDTNIKGLGDKAKNGVIAIHHFSAEYEGHDVDIVIRDKGKKQFLYEMKFIENKKSSQQSTENEVSPTAPNGDVENKPIIPQNQEKSTQNAKKVERKSLADENSSAVEGDERAQEAREGSQTDERTKDEQESVSEAQEAAEREFERESAPKMSERERARGYSDAEADTARSLVKDFDVMSREKRLAIIEMIRSSNKCGASKSFMKHAAAMIGYWRKGLWIIADEKTSEKGFYQSFSDGTRLIVVNPNQKADNGKSAVNTAFVHELGHDIWTKASQKTKDALYRLATEGASAAEVEDIRNEYKAGYKKRGLKLDEDVLREEVFTNLIAKTLGNERFLERFDITPGRMTAFKRSIKAVTRMAKCFFGKDKYLYRKCESMARAFIRAMGEQFAEDIFAGGVRYDLPDGKKNVDPRSVTESDVRVLLQRAYEKKYVDGSYIPIRVNTPRILLEVASDNGTEIKDLPFIMPVRKARQTLSSPLEWAREGNLSTTAHDLSIDEVIQIIKAMNAPKMIIYQADGRYVEVVEFENSEKDKAIAVVEIGENQKFDVMNGYKGGEYQLLITALEPDYGYIESIIKKEGNKVVYPKKEKGSSQRGSGNSAPSHLNDSPFAISIPQNSEKSTPAAKKMFSLDENKSTRGDDFDADEFLRSAMENGGMIEKQGEGVETAKAETESEKSQTSGKKKSKSKTKKQLQAEVKELKSDNRGLRKANDSLAKSQSKAQKQSAELFEKNTELNRKNAGLRLKAANYEKLAASADERADVRKAKEVKRIATAVKKLVNDFSFLVNEATHRKYTAGGSVGATILADPAIGAFAAYFAKKGSAYNIMNKTTRDGVKLLLEFYNPNNPIFADESTAASFFGKDSNNIFSSYRPEIAEMIKAIAEGEGDLSIFEMQQLGDVVRNIRHIYENYDAVRRKGKSESAKVLSARSYEAQVTARSVLESDADERPRLKKIFKFLKEYYLYTVVTPEEVLRDLENHVKDPVLSELYREIRLGEAEAGRIRAEILTPISEFLAKKENREFFDDLSKPTLDFCGIKISVAQAVGIYETSKRKHAQQRLYDPDGGIKIYDAEKGERVDIRGLTKTSIDNLYNQFDDTTKEYIKHLEAAMAACKKYKVMTDRDVMGFTNAVSGHYYPITTDENYFAKDITDIRQAMGAEISDVVKNKSFNQNTVQGAQAPLVIEDSQRVLERHVFGIAQYAGLYIPLQNFGKVYGAKFDPSIPAAEQNRVNDLDKLREAARVTKKTSLREYYNTKVWAKKDGKGGLDSYLTKLFADIQRIKPGETSIIDRAVEVIRSGYVNSVFGLNTKIIFTQLASYPAAFKVIDADCLAQAFGNAPFSNENAEAMDKYSKLTLARSFEGANAADGLIEKLSEFGKKTSIGIEFTDRGVILALYSACQLQIAKDGGAEVGSEANLKAAGELLDNVLLDTQTTSLLSDRSALARDKSEFAKTFSMFKNEAVKAASTFYGSLATYLDHKKLSESDESYGELLEEDKKKLARNLGGYLGSSAVVAAVSIIFSKIRSAGKDEDEKEKLGAMVAKEGVEAVFNLLPIVSDAAAFMMDGYDIDSLPYEVFNDMLTAIRGVSTVFDTNETREAKAKYLRNTAYTAGKVLGLPVQNTARLASTTVAIFNKPLAYKMSDMFDTAKSYKSDLDNAIESGNARLSETIMSLWVSDKMTGEASVKVVDELTRLYGLSDGEGKKLFSMPRNTPSSLSKKEKAKFMGAYSGADEAVATLISSKEYKALDDAAKAQAVKACYDLYYVKGQQVCGLNVTESGARISTAADGLDENLLYSVIGFAKTQSGENKKAHIIQYLISLGLGIKEREKYLVALGYKV